MERGPTLLQKRARLKGPLAGPGRHWEERRSPSCKGVQPIPRRH